MSDQKPKSTITPEEAFANFKKDDAEFEVAIRENFPHRDGISMKLSHKQMEKLAQVKASEAVHEATKLDGIAGIANGKVENGEYLHDMESRVKISLSETVYEIMKKKTLDSGTTFINGVPEIHKIPTETLEQIITEKAGLNKILSTRPKHESVKVEIGDKQLDLTVGAAITFNADVAHFAGIMKKIKEESGSKSEEPKPLPQTIRTLEKPRLI